MFSGSLMRQASALPVAAGAMQIGRNCPLVRQLFQTSSGHGHNPELRPAHGCKGHQDHVAQPPVLVQRLSQTNGGRGYNLSAHHDLGHTTDRGYIVRQHSLVQLLFHTTVGHGLNPELHPAHGCKGRRDCIAQQHHFGQPIVQTNNGREHSLAARLPPPHTRGRGCTER